MLLQMFSVTDVENQGRAQGIYEVKGFWFYEGGEFTGCSFADRSTLIDK